MATTEITRDDVLRTSTNGSYEHPVIDVIRGQLPRLLEVCEGAAQKLNDKRKVNFRPLVDAVERATPFDLNPLDLIAIWAAVTPIPRYRYLMSKAVSSAYVIQGANPEIWCGFPWQHVDRGELNPLQFADRSGLTLIWDRLEEVRQNIQILDNAVFGVEEPYRKTLRRLGKKMRKGGDNAVRKYDEFYATVGQREIPLLEDLQEAFGNGMGGIARDIYRALGR